MGRIFFELRGDIDTEWVFADGSDVRAHQHASGARTGEERAIGRSRGGATTKIHMAADAHGNPVDFEVTGGEVHDAKAAPGLIDKIKAAQHIIADKGYDAEVIREHIRRAGAIPVIPRKSNSRKANPEFGILDCRINDFTTCQSKTCHADEQACGSPDSRTVI